MAVSRQRPGRAAGPGRPGRDRLAGRASRRVGRFEMRGREMDGWLRVDAERPSPLIASSSPGSSSASTYALLAAAEALSARLGAAALGLGL